MAPLRNAEAGAAAAGAEIGAAPDPTTGPDASVAADAATEGAGPARHDVTARPSERPLAKTRRRTVRSAPFSLLPRLGLVLDQRVHVIVRVEEPRSDATQVLCTRLFLQAHALHHELLLQSIIVWLH